LFLTIQKVERWEREVSQALDLAAGYKGKYESVETELFTTQETLSARIVELEEISRRAKEKTSQLEEERKDLAERLQFSQEEHEKVIRGPLFEFIII
jgi:vacuolar-type H+-ATPase subunit I/STV1